MEEAAVIDMTKVSAVLVGGRWLRVVPGSVNAVVVFANGELTTKVHGYTTFLSPAEDGSYRLIALKDDKVEALEVA
jgi:hypothetical protein